MSGISELFNSLFAQNQGRQGRSKMMGPMPAIVTNNVDPEDRYRVKIKFPWLEDSDESFWARIGGSMGGKEMGDFFLPEIDDEVIVSFLEGDFERPVLQGSMWNGKDTPGKAIFNPLEDKEIPLSNNEQGGKNEMRGFNSRGGHSFWFYDEEGGEGGISVRSSKKAELYLNDKAGGKVQLYDQNRNQWLEIDVDAKKITMQTDTGEILIKAKTKITMQCEDLIVEASKSIKVSSGTTSDWDSTGALKWKTSATANYESSAPTTIKGAKIDLNP